VSLVWVDLCNVPRGHMLSMKGLLRAHQDDGGAIAHDVARGILSLSPYHAQGDRAYQGPRVNPAGKLQLEPVLTSVCSQRRVLVQSLEDHTQPSLQDRIADEAPMVLCHLREPGGAHSPLCPVTFLEHQVNLQVTVASAGHSLNGILRPAVGEASFSWTLPQEALVGLRLAQVTRLRDLSAAYSSAVASAGSSC
jgi:hypothetical protein